jgi:rSAM/selenodomain-associated transferase 2
MTSTLMAATKARGRHGARPAISIIIPVLDERENLEHLIPALAATNGPADFSADVSADHPAENLALEIIVVDGASRDGSAETARALGARVLTTAKGRGNQLRAGADAAQGEILWFLHADCRPAAGAVGAIAAALGERPELVGGNFRLLFDGGMRFDRWLTGFYAWFRGFGLYYGDSGIFVRRGAYRECGGFRPIALMEDYDFTRRLERLGATVCINDPPLLTSSRRFRGRSAVAIVYGWLRIHALYHLGVRPERLARMYDSARKTQGAVRSLRSQS